MYKIVLQHSDLHMELNNPVFFLLGIPEVVLKTPVDVPPVVLRLCGSDLLWRPVQRPEQRSGGAAAQQLPAPGLPGDPLRPDPTVQARLDDLLQTGRPSQSDTDTSSPLSANQPALCLQFTLLSAAEQKMSAAVGVPESFVARKAAGQTVKKVADDKFKV